MIQAKKSTKTKKPVYKHNTVGLQQLRWWLEKESVSVTELSEKVGYAFNNVHNWISGKTIPSLQAAVAIEQVTNRKVQPRDWTISLQDT